MNILQRSFSLAAFALAMILSACGVEPIDLVPSLVYQSTASGCADFSLHASNAAGNEFLLVSASKSALGLTTEEKSFDLARMHGDLQVSIDLYTKRPENIPYCSDLLSGDMEKPATWHAVSGLAIISISDTAVAPNDLYKTTVRLENVVFVDPGGNRRVTLKEAIMRDVVVGWFPG